MDPALLREREAFRKKAMAVPTIDNKKKKDKRETKPDVSKKKPVPSSKPLDIVSYKSMAGSSQYKFGVLAKIVKYMKQRHQDGETHPLSIDEVLDETNQLDVGSKVKQWLIVEALKSNPKIEETFEGKYIFKPPYKLKDKKSLLRLLKQHDLKGLGGILLEDIQESLPHSEKVLKSLASELVLISRPIDKKKVVFYNDRTCQFPVDEEFQKLWRAVAVEGVDDNKIEEYLEKNGIRSMQDHGVKKLSLPVKRKRNNQRRKLQKRPRDNEHLVDVLETYDE